MSNDLAANTDQSTSRRRLQFSLLSLLVFATLVSAFLGYIFRTRYCYATTLFQVRSQRSTLWDADIPPLTADQFEIVQKTQVALIKSYLLLQAAIRDPAIGSLPMFAGKDDPVEWLMDQIDVSFPEKSEVLQIRLRGRESDADQLKRIVDAVAKSYLKEVVYAGRQRKMQRRDALSASADKLEQEWKRKVTELQEIKKSLGKEATDDHVELAASQRELDTLGEILDHLRRQIEIEDVNSGAPEVTERIQLIQNAFISPE